MSSKYYIRRSKIRLWRKHHAPIQLGILIDALSNGSAVFHCAISVPTSSSTSSPANGSIADLNHQLPSKRDFQDPKIIQLDEVTSAVDSQTEARRMIWLCRICAGAKLQTYPKTSTSIRGRLSALLSDCYVQFTYLY